MSLTWSPHPPKVEDISGLGSEEYYWIRGGDYNRPVVVRVNKGARNIGGLMHPALNVMFYSQHLPDYIWMDQISQWHSLRNLEWAGPVPRPPIE